MRTKYLDTPYAIFEMHDGILHLYYKRGLLINLEMAREIVSARLEFSNNESFPMLIVDLGIVGVEKAARDWFSSEEGTCRITACALVLDTVYSRVLGNFFIKITRPRIPVKVFNQKAKGVEWLHHFISEKPETHLL